MSGLPYHIQSGKVHLFFICPFCGRKNVIERIDIAEGFGLEGYILTCKRCGAKECERGDDCDLLVKSGHHCPKHTPTDEELKKEGEFLQAVQKMRDQHKIDAMIKLQEKKYEIMKQMDIVGASNYILIQIVDNTDVTKTFTDILRGVKIPDVCIVLPRRNLELVDVKSYIERRIVMREITIRDLTNPWMQSITVSPSQWEDGSRVYIVIKK